MIAVDWPDHGNSSADPQPPSAARYEALLAGLLDDLGIDDAVLIGNSIGGAAALRYAASHPGRVRGLVLANPGGLDPEDHDHVLVLKLLCTLKQLHVCPVSRFRGSLPRSP